MRHVDEDANDEERSMEFCGLRVLPGLKREGLVAWILLDSVCFGHSLFLHPDSSTGHWYAGVFF